MELYGFIIYLKEEKKSSDNTCLYARYQGIWGIFTEERYRSP